MPARRQKVVGVVMVVSNLDAGCTPFPPGKLSLYGTSTGVLLCVLRIARKARSHWEARECYRTRYYQVY